MIDREALRAAHVRLDGVTIHYDGRPVFRDLSCAFPRGRISVVLGGSGEGKTTLLRLIGGLVRPQSGAVVVEGRDIVGLTERDLFRMRSRLGMMFQGGALLDSMSVFDNLAFPLREHTGLREPEIRSRVLAGLEAVGLSHAGGLMPHQLSGGMLKRVALARGMMMDPEILLCDEPLSGLDPLSVGRIERLLVRTQARVGCTLIMASHHIPSTLRMADLVLLVSGGELLASGTPAELTGSGDPLVERFLSEAPPADGGREGRRGG